MRTPLADRVDAVVGSGIEAAVMARHRSRLRHLGHAQVLAPEGHGLWASAQACPRSGCQLDVLIDGASALPKMARAMREARHYIHITGWHLEPSFELIRDQRPVVIGTLLAELAEQVDVRVLVWAGAPIPAFHPSRREVRKTVENLVRGTRIRGAVDPREHPFHCHHEKTIVVDGELAFVGGIDLTNSAGDRFDSQDHEARRQLGWHDATALLGGPAVADVDDHFAFRWHEVTGERLARRPPPAPSGSHTVQVVRTVAEDMYAGLPKGEFSVLEGYVRALRSAERLIYLESQFLWAPEIVAILAEKLERPPHPDFRVVLVLPARPNNGRDTTLGQLGVLVDADEGRQRVLATTIRCLSAGRDDPLYVHAKIGIVDDRWLTIGSANLNDHSLLHDTEMNLVSDDPQLARETRIRLWAEHLELDAATVAAADPRELIDERWRPIAYEQLDRLRAGAPPSHRLLALPGVSRRSRRLLGPLVSLIDDR
jgi:phosphatidylserine/phosphatidylglycerophosphate/cardiolipin synthase-like enzyme